MSKTKGFLLAVAVAAMAFTFSCSSDDDGGGGGGSGKGNDIKNYRTVDIGTQTWMAENLNYAVAGSKCYDNDPANCEKYGRLYDWSTAKTVCPAGWHLPSDAEWDELVAFAGGGAKLMAASGWNSGNGTDEFGFSALPGGYGYSGSFSNVGDYGYWWSATESDDNYAECRYISFGVYRESCDKSGLLSVRCVQD